MPKFSTTRLLGLLLILALGATLRAETKSDSAAATKDEPKISDEPVLSVTAHTVTVGGKTLKYHATAGYLMLKEEEGKPLLPGLTPPPAAPDGDKAKEDEKKPKDGLKPKAKIFFVAYTLDDVADPAARPLTFCFNGGPGSASVWLHMASVAPRRAALTEEGEAPPPPYQLVDNESTWLDRTDLVFLDPVSTGYSRTMPK